MIRNLTITAETKNAMIEAAIAGRNIRHVTADQRTLIISFSIWERGTMKRLYINWGFRSGLKTNGSTWLDLSDENDNVIDWGNHPAGDIFVQWVESLAPAKIEIAEAVAATDEPAKVIEAVGIDADEYQAEVDANMARFAAESAPAIEVTAQTFEQEMAIALEAGDMEGFIAHQIERNAAHRRADKAAGKPTQPSFSRAFRELQGNPHAVTSAQDDPALWNLMQR